MVNGPGLPGSPFRTAILAPFGSEGGTAPHLMSCLFMIMESAPKAGAAMQSAAAIRVCFMVPPVDGPVLGRSGMVDLTRSKTGTDHKSRGQKQGLSLSYQIKASVRAPRSRYWL